MYFNTTFRNLHFCSVTVREDDRREVPFMGSVPPADGFLFSYLHKQQILGYRKVVGLL